MLKLETYINCNMNKIHKPVHTKKKDRYITHIQCACVCVCDMQMTFERTNQKHTKIEVAITRRKSNKTLIIRTTLRYRRRRTKTVCVS